jgi:transposase
MAATAAQRLGLTPHVAPLERPSVHGDGRDTSDEAPDEQVIHRTRGYSRDHRPDRNPVLLELMVQHQAGIPMLMPPRSGNRSDAPAFGQMIRGHLAQVPITYGMTSLVAESALYREANLQQRAQPPRPWSTRAPVTLSDARAALVQAAPQTMRPLVAGYRAQEVASTYGGVEHRWGLIHAEPRQAQAQRTVATPLRTQRAQEVNACKKRCGTAVAGEADAPQALATFAQEVQATCLATSRVGPTSRDGKRGRPRLGSPPASVVYHSNGALAARLAMRHARVDQPSWCILATNALDAMLLPPPERLRDDTGQSHAERGFRFLKDPQL